MRRLEGKAGSLMQIAADSASFALSGLKTDRFRTILSLSGVSIGIFSVVAVFTLVDSLQESLNEGLRQFGSDVVFVERIPLEPDLNETGIFKWWEYISRPEVSYREYLYLKENGRTFGDTGWACFLNDGDILGVDGESGLFVHNKIGKGRSFTEAELKRGAAVAVAGADYASAHKVDSIVNLYGVRCTIIGTFESSGINSASLADVDRSIFVPAKLAMRMNGFAGCRTSLALRPAKGVGEEAFTNDIVSLMRRCRRLTPGTEDNFSINRLSFIISEMDELFGMVDMIGWIIGAFSLLVGGFGIANIMFVTVKERTWQIGLQKAIGAKKRTVVFQYLTEAVTLALMGAGAGIALVWLVSLPLNFGPLDIRLSLSNVLSGIVTAVIIGIAAGVAPATTAANLHPAEALVQE